MRQKGRSAGEPLPGAELPWQTWLPHYFPHVASAPLADRHTRLWEWFEALTPGVRPRPRVEVWPRGGAKSSSGELGCSRVAAKLSRRFVLYVCATQDAADKHVQSIATLLEKLGAERLVGKYSNSKGWKRDQLRTANGFNIAGIGLDVAVRGVKIDEFRPDLIIFDDIDNQHDTLKTVEKKISAITESILPTGSSDCAYLFLQNLIHEEGIVAQLVDGRADFLHNREVPTVEKAVNDLKYESFTTEDGGKRYRIIGGVPTWAGQDLRTCEAQIETYGLKAFLREMQQEVTGAEGTYFDVSQLQYCAPGEVPPLVAVCLAWDLAATEGGGDWTVGALIGKAANGNLYVLAVIRGQWGASRVRGCISLAEAYYKRQYPKLKVHLPQDPSQAGKDQAEQFRKSLADAQLIIESVRGAKSVRAEPFSDAVNRGAVFFVQQDLPEFLTASVHEETNRQPLFRDAAARSYRQWHAAAKEELRKFREDERDQVDDQVDGLADAANEVLGYRPRKSGWRGSTGGYA